MRYLYFKSEKGNFGDDLNPWLWRQFFGENNENDLNVLLGIGSILFNDFSLIKSLKPEHNKIVFGAGIRPNFKHFKIDETWDIKFLRGPLSSSSTNNKYKFIADAAYSMRLLDGFENLKNTPKKYEIGLMPYFRSVDYFDWKRICNELGFRLISPYSENGVEDTMKEIASCKFLITEAMHGAIVSDILRVPWSRYILTTPFTEGSMVSEFKWMDWLHSINLGNTDTTVIEFYRKFFINKYFMRFSSNIINPEFLIKSVVKKDILEILRSINNFYLSSDNILKTIDDKINTEVYYLKSQLGQV